MQNDPFLFLRGLCSIVKNVFKFVVSKELVRTAIKVSGLTKKKARFFGRPKDLNDKIESFVKERDSLIRQGYTMFSLDETSFGRNGKQVMGYSLKGKQLCIPKLQPRMTTQSYLVMASKESIVQKIGKVGSFKTQDMVDFIKAMEVSKHSVVILDNVSFHHSQSVKSLFEEKGIKTLYTPPYCPRFNPIEGIFSIVKRAFYKGTTIEQSFKSVTKNHCESFFRFSFSQRE